MILRHLKIGFRHLIKDKFYTFLNFSGLCIGILIAIYITTWVIDELNYEKHFSHSELIYRVERDFNYNGLVREMPVTSFNYARALENTFPEIEVATKLYPFEIYFNDINNIFRKEKVFFTDSCFFNIFNFDFISGSADLALNNPNSIIVTKKAAVKLFGKENVLGETIDIKIENLKYSLKVTGILNDIPQNSHFHPEIIIPLPILKEYYQVIYNEWRVNVGYTYIKVDNAKSIEKIKSQLPNFLLQHVDAAYRTMLDDKDDINDAFTVKLKNIQDIHLKSHLEYEIETNGKLTNVYLLSIIAILILLLAIINYVNLNNTRSETRSLEIGIRKTIGSTKTQLIKHFFLESFSLIFLAFISSILLTFAFSNIYERISEKNFHWIFFDSLSNFSILFFTFILIALLAGLYPSILVSKFSILKSLKGKRQSVKKNRYSKALPVIFQFIISIGLITFSLLMSLQINLINKKDLGFNKDNLLVIEVDNPKVRSQYLSFKQELNKYSGIENVTSAGTVPINQIYPSLTVKRKIENDNQFLAYVGVNYDYIETMGMSILSGRSFSEEFSDTSEIRYIINESACKLMGYSNPEDALGEIIETKSHLVSTYNKGKIIGVVNDFNIKSLHTKIEPAGLQLYPEYLSAIFIRLQQENINKTIKEIKRLWQNRFPESEFNYYFLSDKINSQYKSEQGLQQKVMLSTIIAILIGCMGLIGLSMYVLQQRTKEIGIRKANGATPKNLIVLFLKQYFKWINIAAIIVCPISFVLFKEWLNNFAIKINVNLFWLIFLLSWLVILVISLITILGQTVKYSKLNPVDVLKYE